MEEYTKKCPYCGGEINITAIKCKHCRKFINDYHKETVADNNKAKGFLKIFIYTFCAFICVISLLAMIPTSDDPQTIAENNKKAEQRAEQTKRENELKRIERESQIKRQQEEQEIQRLQREYEKQQREQQVKLEKLEILETFICFDDYRRAVCGTVRNNKNRSVYMVSVDISLFDNEGNLVSNITDFIEEIRPGQVWKFKAHIDTTDASTFNVNGVSGW